MRDNTLDELNKSTCPVIYTEFTPKRAFCNKLGFLVDIWIDDQPELIVYSGEYGG